MAFFTDLLSPPPTFVNVFPISLGKKCPVSLFQSMVSYLPGAGKRSLPESRERPFPKARRYGRENGRTISFRLPDKRRGTLSDGTGNGKFRRTAEAPCDGTDGCVPFVLPPDVRLRPCSITEWSETDAGTGQPVRQGLSARQ